MSYLLLIHYKINDCSFTQVLLVTKHNIYHYVFIYILNPVIKLSMPNFFTSILLLFSTFSVCCIRDGADTHNITIYEQEILSDINLLIFSSYFPF